MYTKETNLTVISNKTFEATKDVNLNYHDISSALQTTLEFGKLIAIFSNKIINLVPHSAYAYINFEMGQGIKKGVMTKHSCSYALRFDSQQLGELSFMRNEMFASHELELLEALLCCLIWPLKNAILYQKALKMANAQSLETLLEANNKASEAFGKAFSNGVNAHIEHNRRITDKKNLPTNQKSEADDRCPWAVGFLR
jgi:hypothetical protein